MAHENESSVTERAPLLPNKRPAFARQTSILSTIHVPKTHSPWVVVLLMSFMVFCVMVGAYLALVPQYRIMEDIICHRYYDGMEGSDHIALSGTIDESMCKGDEIQSELAVILGVQEFVDAIPGIAFAFPYGLLADRVGRKLVFGLGIGGIVLSILFQAVVFRLWHILPLRLVWMSPVFQMIGGGTPVVQNMIFSTIADVSTDASRANNFFVAACGGLIAEMIAPAIAAWLMQRTPWLPFLLGVSVVVLGSCVMFFVPETLHLHPANGNITENTPPSSRASSITQVVHKGLDGDTFLAKTRSFVSLQGRRLYDATRVLHTPSIVLLILTFATHNSARAVINFSTRYISKRYSWSLSNTSFLLSVRAGVNVVLLLAILPLLAFLLTFQAPSPSTPDQPRAWYARFTIGMSVRAKDLFLARASLLFLIAGLVLLAAAPTIEPAIVALTIFTLGTGFTHLTRSVITTLVDQEHTSRLYSAISVVDTVGMLAVGPGLAGLYSWGLKQARQGKGQAWMGAPLFGAAVAFVVMAGGVFAVRLPGAGKIGTGEEVGEVEVEVEVEGEANDGSIGGGGGGGLHGHDDVAGREHAEARVVS